MNKIYGKFWLTNGAVIEETTIVKGEDSFEHTQQYVDYLIEGFRETFIEDRPIPGGNLRFGALTLRLNDISAVKFINQYSGGNDE